MQQFYTINCLMKVKEYLEQNNAEGIRVCCVELFNIMTEGNYLMNKLEGFYHLQSLGVPAVPWQIFSDNELLDPSLLWTIRVAVERGDDMNLPRAVGVNAETAYKKARELLNQFQNRGIVVYYPYFIAVKSGNLEVGQNSIVIEAVKDDLWNLTTNGGREVTAIIDWRTRDTVIHGDKDLLEQNEINQLINYSGKVRARLKDYISHNCSALLEWSYAVNCNADNQPIGDPYLVFYECRTICSNQ